MKDLALSYKGTLLAALVLLVLVFLVYGDVLHHDFLNGWDDDNYVTANQAIRGISAANLKTAFTSIYVGNYAPLQIVSYMLDYALWGLRSSGFLLTNLLLHWANGLLFLGLAAHMTKSRLAASVATFIFLFHPVQVETVAWVSQRKNVLAMFFFLVALLGWCYWRQRGHRSFYFASLAACCCAVLAKSVAVVLPGILILYDACFVERNDRKKAMAVLPFVGVAVVAAVLNIIVQDPGVGHGGGRAPWHGGSPLATFYTMLPVLLLYLKMLFWPVGLSALYDPQIRTGIDLQVVLAALALLAVAGLMVVLWSKDRLQFFCLAVFWLCLLPVSQIVPLVTLMNDRYLYFPLLGAAMACGAFMAWGMKVARSKSARLIVIFATMVILSPLPSLANRRVSVWKNSLALWSDVVTQTPSSKWGWIGLGEVYRNKHLIVPALNCYERVLAIDPVSVSALINLGLLHTSQNDTLQGRAYLIKAMELYPAHPPVYAALGDNYRKEGEVRKAILAYERALQLNPKDTVVARALEEVNHDLARR